MPCAAGCGRGYIPISPDSRVAGDGKSDGPSSGFPIPQALASRSKFAVPPEISTPRLPTLEFRVLLFPLQRRAVVVDSVTQFGGNAAELGLRAGYC
jgi:hypothetical protein